MNSLVVHFTKFGNTQMVAEAIQDVLAGGGQALALPMEQVDAADLAAADLVVMGSPTHKGNLPEAVRPLLQALPKRSLRGKSVAAFDTSYRMNAFLSLFTAAKPLARQLRKLGGKQVAGPETFHVVGREGPLYDGEIERAQAWAASILARANGGTP